MFAMRQRCRIVWNGDFVVWRMVYPVPPSAARNDVKNGHS
jgi:hypothetical protein